MSNFPSVIIIAAIVPIALAAGVARAQEAHIPVGDLTRPSQVAAFERHLTAATTTICGTSPLDTQYPSRLQSCAASVREDALGQLQPAQRAQLAAYAVQPVRLAAQGR